MRLAVGLATAVSAFAIFLALPALKAGAQAAAQISEQAGKCQALASFALKDGQITSAVHVDPTFETPAFLMPANKAMAQVPFCRIAGVLKPTPSSNINVEIWLPDQLYVGRFAGVGNAAYAGSINYPAMARMLNMGFAVYSTDRGHQNDFRDKNWAWHNPEAVMDHKRRATHLGAVLGKQLVERYYGTPARYSYFEGCSAGGQQAISAALHHPEDFNGIIGGDYGGVSYDRLPPDAPPFANPDVIFPPAVKVPQPKLELVTRAAITACDTNDGVKDGFIGHPNQCRFDPAKLLCTKGDKTDCLTQAEIAAVKEGYAIGAHPGSEHGWRQLEMIASVPEPQKDPNAYFAVFESVPSADTIYMRRFAARGGKFLSYGNVDSILSIGLERYYRDSAANLQKSGLSRDAAQSRLKGYHRLFPMPATMHCMGGNGPTDLSPAGAVPQSDPSNGAISAIVAWVEQGKAPDYLVAAKHQNGMPVGPVVMTRPICAYPAVTQWDGKGNTNDYRSFRCVKPGD